MYVRCKDSEGLKGRIDIIYLVPFFLEVFTNTHFGLHCTIQVCLCLAVIHNYYTHANRNRKIHIQANNCTLLANSPSGYVLHVFLWYLSTVINQCEIMFIPLSIVSPT